MDSPDLVAAHLARNLASLRHTRALTQDALAKAAAVPRSTIANLESGVGNPSLVVLVKVADALACRSTNCPPRRARRCGAGGGRGRRAQSSGRGVTIRELVPEPVPDEMMKLMDFEPGASMRGTPHLPGTREFFTASTGRVTIFVAGERYELGAGDVLGFPRQRAHSYQNADAMAPARGVSVVVLAKAGV